MNLKNQPIYVAGHTGMVGSAVIRQLEARGYTNVIRATSAQLDLRNQKAVRNFFHTNKPKSVVVAAATVGGIQANNAFKGDFIYNNLQIQTNIIQAAKETRVKKLIFLGSSCIYPKEASQPIIEESLLTGPLEPTNEPYAIAKIAGLKLCESFYHQHQCNFYSLMPCNLYGINDNFDLNSSHVLPALLRKFHTARINGQDEVEVWGSGKPRREFLLVDDLASTITHCLENIDAQQIYSKNISHLNVGSGIDISIKDLAHKIAKITEFQGSIKFNPSQPDGTLRKLMDISRLKELNLPMATPLEEGLTSTYEWFKNNYESAKGIGE